MRPMLLVLLAACKGAGPATESRDADGDGFGVDEDCNDDDENVFPGAPERCDEVDQDCDGDTSDPLAVHVDGGPAAADLAEALLLAQVDQTIVLCPGTHASALVRDRVLRGVGEGVIIDAAGVGSAIEAQGRVELHGLTLTGGAGSAGPLGGAVGGGINATAATSLVAADVIIEGNTAEHGGGIATGAGPTSLERVTIRDNEATSGGGLHVTDGDVACAETTIQDNTADAGGGVRMIDGTISGCTVLDNAVIDDGGGVYVSGVAEIRNSTIEGNTAVRYGGGVHLLPGADVVLQGSTVRDNTAELGGGVFVNPHGMLDMTASTSTENVATAEGGGLYIWTAEVDGGVMLDNQATDFGGGVAIFEGGSLAGARVEGNTAPSGAGIQVRNGDASLSSTQVIGNDAADNGGGLYLREAVLEVNAVVVQNNEAGERGGGVYLSEATLHGLALLVSGNEADAGGGGYISSAGPSVMIGRYEGNTAETGAGLAILGPSTLAVEVVDNTATVRGGGVYTDGVEAVVVGSLTVTGNEAADFGGGIYTQDQSSLTLDGDVQDNTAPLGAGVYVNGASAVTLASGSTVSGNGDATLPGGGIRINEGMLTTTDTSFSDNDPHDVYTVGNGTGTSYPDPVSLSCTEAGCG